VIAVSRSLTDIKNSEDPSLWGNSASNRATSAENATLASPVKAGKAADVAGDGEGVAGPRTLACSDDMTMGVTV
jgi:hypothetical protein